MSCEVMRSNMRKLYKLYRARTYDNIREATREILSEAWIGEGMKE